MALTHWLARSAQALLMMFWLVPDLAAASADPLCNQLLLLDRLPGHARRLLAPSPLASVRSAYLADIERASTWPDTSSSGARLQDEAVMVEKAVALHRRFLSLTETAGAASGGYLIESLDWHRVDAWVDKQMRLRNCAGPSTSKPPDAAPKVVKSHSSPADTGASSLSQAALAGHNLKVPAFLTGELLVRLLVAGAILAGACLLVRWRERRESPRHFCFISGALQSHLYCEATEIVDISQIGCKLRLYDRLIPDRPLTLFFGNFRIQATAIWSNSHYAGLRFETRLTPTQLRDILELTGQQVDTGGPPVPSLPCHRENCQATCTEYKLMQEGRAGMRKAGAGSIDLAN